MTFSSTALAREGGAALLLPSGDRSPGSLVGLHQHLMSSLLPLGRHGSGLLILGDGESPDSPLGLLWHHQVGRDGSLSSLPCGGRLSDSLLGLPWHCRPALLTAAWDENPGSLLGLPWHHSIRDIGHLITPLWGWKSRLPTGPVRMEVGPQSFSVEFG